jgi:hypothetical protein
MEETKYIGWWHWKEEKEKQIISDLSKTFPKTILTPNK